jgi:hypothetical protein
MKLIRSGDLCRINYSHDLFGIPQDTFTCYVINEAPTDTLSAYTSKTIASNALVLFLGHWSFTNGSQTMIDRSAAVCLIDDVKIKVPISYLEKVI